MSFSGTSGGTLGVTLYVQTVPPGLGYAELHKAAHALLAAGLWRKYGLAPEALCLGAGAHGKPYLKGRDGIQFSISHTSGMVVCAMGPLPIGVDVEHLRPVKERVARKVFSPAELRWFEGNGRGEKEFLRLWTLKESYVKTTGDGLSFPLREAAFRFGAHGEIGCSCPGYRFRQLDLWDRFILSVCVQDAAEEKNSVLKEDNHAGIENNNG